MTKSEPFLAGVVTLMLLTELRPRAFSPLSSSPRDSVDCRVKPLRLGALRQQTTLSFAMQLCSAVPRPPNLLQTLNQMQAARGVHDTRDLARLERKCGVLKLLLHVAAAEIPQITPLACAAAVGLGDCQVAEGNFAALDAILVSFDDLLCVVFAASDI